MFAFCPLCGNMLGLHKDLNANLSCKTCPYQFPLEKKLGSKSYFKKKQIDDILGGEKAWQNVDAIDVSCPKCEHGRAYFMQMQIRSADEPMSIFYKCCNHRCNHQWREK